MCARLIFPLLFVLFLSGCSKREEVSSVTYTLPGERPFRFYVDANEDGVISSGGNAIEQYQEARKLYFEKTDNGYLIIADNEEIYLPLGTTVTVTKVKLTVK